MLKFPFYGYVLVGLDVLFIALCVFSVLFFPFWVKLGAFFLGTTTVILLIAGLRRAKTQGIIK